LVHQIDTLIYFLASKNKNECDAIIKSISNEATIIVHTKELIDYFLSKGYIYKGPCYQVLYDSNDPLEYEKRLCIKHPDMSDYEKASKTYFLYQGDEFLKDFKSKNFFGAYFDNKIVGYMGIHSDGSMGMLHIFDEYRGLGYAMELQKFMINHQLSKGEYAYGQVFIDNIASMSLQRKLGMKVSDDYIGWMKK
ncbi:MAG: GNAT family N-acetyltransferase, partial [Clostridia bacterium]|nr:GNAT family N-acetyltransferase [Clostridia bacterium]